MAPLLGTDAPSLGRVIREARENAGLTLRELARRAGISHSQISRLESEQVAKPSREVLVALARGLERNPNPLLLLAGHLGAAESADLLRTLFRPGSELREIWAGCSSIPLDDVDQIVVAEHPDASIVQRVAADAFLVHESDETLWDDSYGLAAARGADAEQLRELMSIWRFIASRRTDLLEYGRLLRRQADLEYIADARIAELLDTENE